MQAELLSVAIFCERPPQANKTYENEDTEVIVTFKNSKQYWGRFVTYKAFEEMQLSNPDNHYEVVKSFVLVQKTDRETIEKVVKELIDSDRFLEVFSLTMQ